MRTRIALAFVALGLCAAVASADITVHDNFGSEFSYNPNQGKTISSFNIGTGHDRDAAMYFVSTVSGPISNFWIAINHWFSGANEFTVWLAADEGGLPGAQIGTAWEFIDMAPSGVGGGGPPIRGVGDGSHMLVAGEKYWLAASSLDPYADTYGVWCDNSIGDESPYAKRVDLGPWELEDQSFQTRSAFRIDVEEEVTGDFDGDEDVDLYDFAAFQICFSGDGNPYAGGTGCEVFDFDFDDDIDLADHAELCTLFTGPGS